MILLTYQNENAGTRAGVKAGDVIVDLTELLECKEVIEDVKMLMEIYPDAVSRIQKALDCLDEKSDVHKFQADTAKLCTPVLHPTTLRDSCMFEVHSNNAGAESDLKTPPLWYERPIFYYQNPNSLSGPEAEVKRKVGDTTLDYEAEVAFVVGKKGFSVKAGDAEEYILGLTIFNDWSDRALCIKESGFLGMHKSKDFAAGVGPWIVTFDEFKDKMTDGKLNLAVKAWVNDVQTTDSHTNDMYWPIGRLLEVVSEDIEIFPGDIVGLGTVGLGCIFEQEDKFPFLKDGDKVEIEVEGIGTLRQYVAK